MYYSLKVQDNKDLEVMAKELAASLGYRVDRLPNNVKYLSILYGNTNNLYSFTPDFELPTHRLVSVSEWIGCLKRKYPKKHTITIEGKEIEISDESFQELKKALCNES